MKINFKTFIIISGFILILFYIYVFSPIISYGDGTVYLNYANEIAEHGNTDKYLHRSPLQPWLISFIIKPLGLEKTARVVMIFNYITIYLTGLILFSLIQKYIASDKIAFVSTILFYFNLSVIFYGYVLLTETLTMFLMMVTVSFVVKTLHHSSIIYPLLAGIFVSLTVLCRFNILPLILVFFTSIVIIGYFSSNSSLNSVLRKAFLFIIPVLFLLGSFSYLNYRTRGFLGIFPSGGSKLVSRNALIVTINGDERVSNDKKEVLKIFYEAKEKFLTQKQVTYRTSLRIPFREYLLRELTGGFEIYKIALPALCNFFNINPERPEPELSKKLAPFYKEIRRINNNNVWKLRFLSLFTGFLSSAGLVAPESSYINLGRLPNLVIIGYKLIFPLFTALVLLYSIAYLIKCITGIISPDRTILLFIFIIYGFFFVNFAFATVFDANRFKFPAEPMIITLGVFWSKNLWDKLKEKQKLLHNQQTVAL